MLWDWLIDWFPVTKATFTLQANVAHTRFFCSDVTDSFQSNVDTKIRYTRSVAMWLLWKCSYWNSCECFKVILHSSGAPPSPTLLCSDWMLCGIMSDNFVWLILAKGPFRPNPATTLLHSETCYFQQLAQRHNGFSRRRAKRGHPKLKLLLTR